MSGNTCTVCGFPASVAVEGNAFCGDCYFCSIGGIGEKSRRAGTQRCTSCGGEIEPGTDAFVCGECFRRLEPLL